MTSAPLPSVSSTVAMSNCRAELSERLTFIFRFAFADALVLLAEERGLEVEMSAGLDAVEELLLLLFGWLFSLSSSSPPLFPSPSFGFRFVFPGFFGSFE